MNREGPGRIEANMTIGAAAGAVSVDFFVASEKALRKIHGSRMVGQAEFNELIRLLAAVEEAWKTLKPDERKKKKGAC